MPRIDDRPSTLKPYIFHGLDISYRPGSEALASCPWCGKDNKFSINVDTGLWRCLTCNEGRKSGRSIQGGNAAIFLSVLWQRSLLETKEEDYVELAEDRKLLSPDTLHSWGVCKSIITGDWLVPAFTAEGNLATLYSYRTTFAGRNVLYATAEMGSGLFGVNRMPSKADSILLCEGPWDAMALGETIELNGGDDSTGILAVPGCNIFLDCWRSLFANKMVSLLYDNDHPRLVKQIRIPPAAYEGMKKVAQTFAVSEEPPAAIKYLKWSADSDHNPDIPSGYDIRDLLSETPSPTGRFDAYQRILEALAPIPNDWVLGRSPASAARGQVAMEILPCTEWHQLRNAWQRALKWTDGLNRALAVMLASITSTRAIGDQLWVKIIGPPGTGKTVLCEALTVARKFCIAKSVIRGFHSGYREKGNDTDKDFSLIAQLYNKTLITKDGDTLLQSPNLGQILAEARDLFDSVSRSNYRVGIDRNYEGVRMTWILCGTSSLRALDNSELGERFLDCVIMDGIDEDIEDNILRRVAHQADRDTTYESNGKAESQYNPDRVKAMQLTGGYVTYLRNNASNLLSSVQMSDGAKDSCINYGKFVAYLRARPSRKQEESEDRELASRLVSQMVRLAKCLAVVLNKTTVDAEVLALVRLVALDTARGRTFDLISYLHRCGQGTDTSSLTRWTGESDEKTLKLLRFLRGIKATESFITHTGGSVHWRLTAKVRDLYDIVVNQY